MRANRFLAHAGVEVPVVCGAMYPCSNPELVAAVSEAGGIGIVQPLSLVYVHHYEFRKGLEKIRSLTRKPVGLNVLTEKSLSRLYRKRMETYVDVALEHGVRFFVTALGNPAWVVEKVRPFGGVVYHDVVDRKWAEKALEGGVQGLLCVNSRAGGHAGSRTPGQLVDDLGPLGVPLLCAGGVGSPAGFARALALGYEGVQMGTRFIATTECDSHEDYKTAILKAREEDIVLTERITGVPLAVIRTPYVERIGTEAGPLGRLLLRGRTTKHWMRAWYSVRSFRRLKEAIRRGSSTKDAWQAGKSVGEIDAVLTVEEVMAGFAAAYREAAAE
jgi:nitronate monooxygenase